jgi:hypothetical protein
VFAFICNASCLEAERTETHDCCPAQDAPKAKSAPECSTVFVETAPVSHDIFWLAEAPMTAAAPVPVARPETVTALTAIPPLRSSHSSSVLRI